MKPLHPAFSALFGDPEGKRAEDCLRRLVIELEHSGIAPESIGKALSRTLLGFCAAHAEDEENSGWGFMLLGVAGDALRRHAALARARWVKKFLARQAAIFEDASHNMLMENLPELPDNPAHDLDLPLGHA